ncbi:MAG TPA: hypothetical protein VK465_06960 [Fibrobacteria bacterium]|nr:hypothetical protein [Fibrobacteria bacterium]
MSYRREPRYLDGLAANPGATDLVIVKVWLQGLDAARMGENSNPHPVGTWEHYSWAAGRED